jgi:pilus assembly protein Flp/PilA
VTRPPTTLTQTSPQPNPTTSPLGFAHLLQDESGQDLIEYALLAALIGLAATTAMKGLATKISGSFNSVGSTLTSSV